MTVPTSGLDVTDLDAHARLVLEKAVIGAMLLGLQHETKELLEMDWFRDSRTRRLFQAVCELEPEACNLLGLWVHIKHAGWEKPCGGAAFVGELIDDVPKTLHFAKLLRQEALQERRADAIAEASIQVRMGMEVGPDLQALLEETVETDADALQSLDLSELNDAKQPDWIVPEWFSRQGDLVVLAGEAGTGKTLLGYDLAIAMATSTPWLKAPVYGPAKVLFIDEENSKSLIAHRFRRLAAGRHTDPSLLKPYIEILYANRVNLLNAATRAKILARIEDFRPDWVILDSMVRLHGLDENSNVDMARFFSEGVGPLRRHGAGVILLHHLGKPQAQGPGLQRHRVRGASDIMAAPDSVFLLYRNQENKLILRQEKNRNVSPARPIEITILDANWNGIDSMTISGSTTYDGPS